MSLVVRVELQWGHFGSDAWERGMNERPQRLHTLISGTSFHFLDLHDGHREMSSDVLPSRVVHLYPHLLHWRRYVGSSHLMD